jgi:hypothetical protein
VDRRTARHEWFEPEAEADPDTFERLAAGPEPAEEQVEEEAAEKERAAHGRIDRRRWPSLDAGFDRWSERNEWQSDLPMRAATTDTDAWRYEGRAEAPAPPHPAHAARTGTRLVPSSVARFAAPLSSANARRETPVRWPEDLSDRWPELPEDPSGPADRWAEDQVRTFERIRRLDTEQLGTRWNA